jgi:glycosyltransferase involved in cell wall biosynthesis
LIADAVGIQDYYLEKFNKPTDLITYGAPILDAAGSDRLAELGLTADGYHLVVARFEPENHVEMIVEGYTASSASKPLIVVGSAPYADEYTQRVRAAGDERVRFLGGVWDQELLDQLYANAFTYLHGHSVGGTNPSLLRALGASASTTAFDVVFNREALGEAGRYFGTAADVREQVERSENEPAETRMLGSLARLRADSYDWEQVTDRYESLCRRLAGCEAAPAVTVGVTSTPEIVPARAHREHARHSPSRESLRHADRPSTVQEVAVRRSA